MDLLTNLPLIVRIESEGHKNSQGHFQAVRSVSDHSVALLAVSGWWIPSYLIRGSRQTINGFFICTNKEDQW